jgi:hypothetical protein
MAGNNALAKLYSWADGVKRRARNPMQTLALGLTQANEDLQQAATDADIAYGRNGMKSVLLSQQQRDEAAKRVAQFGEQMGMAAATVWHGSPHKFDKFDMNAPKTTGGNFNKHGVSVSDHQSVAQRYADDFGGKNGQLYKVDADIGNPLELSARDFHSLQRLTGEVDHAAKTGKSISESNSVSLEMLLKKNGINWNWQQGEHPIEAIKRAGHDAIKGAGYPSRNGLAEQETLVFNPSLLRILERNGMAP